MASVDPRDALELRDIRPVVALPSAGLSTRVLIAGAALLALTLFFTLDMRRRALLDPIARIPQESGRFITSPAPLTVPPEPPRPLARTVTVDRAVIVSPRPPRPFSPAFATVPIFPSPPPIVEASRPGQLTPMQTSQRSDSPILTVDTTSGIGGSATAGAAKDQVAAAGGDDAVRATLIRNRSSLIPQGTLIQAVLETPLNSSRPGLARAVVARDALSFDGSRTLIPRGSRLIGEYQADTGADARRVLVTWTRMIRPDGVAIRIGSPSGDALGGAGIPGKVNTHFFERFSNAVLQSALTVGVNLASQRTTSNSLYVGIPGQATSIGQQLFPSITPRTTIKVRQGAEISIFVAHDLDFGGTPPVL